MRKSSTSLRCIFSFLLFFLLMANGQAQEIKQHKNGKFGLIGPNEKWVSKAKWDMIRPFSEGFAAIQKGKKWGFLNEKGVVVIKPRFAEVRDFSSAVAAVKQSSKWTYILPSGQPLFGEDKIPNISWAGDFHGELAFLKYTKDASDWNEKDYKLIDKKGNVLREQIYSFGPWKNERCFITFYSTKSITGRSAAPFHYVYINKEGKELSPVCLDSFNLDNAPVLVKNSSYKQAYLDKDAKNLTDWHGSLTKLDNAVILAQDYPHYSCAYNADFKVIVPIDKYKEIKLFSSKIICSQKINSEELSFYDLSGKFLLQSKTALVAFQSYFIFNTDKGFGVVDANLNIIIPDELQAFKIATNCLLVKKQGKWGALNADLKEIVPAQYEQLVSAKDYPNHLFFSQNGKKGLMDLNHKILIPATKYEDILAVPGKEDWLEVKEKNKYNIVDFSGKQLLSSSYDALNFAYLAEGFILVQSKEKWGVLDLKGKAVLPLNYNKIAYKGGFLFADFEYEYNTFSDILDKNGKRLYRIQDLSYEYFPESGYFLLEDGQNVFKPTYSLLNAQTKLRSNSSNSELKGTIKNIEASGDPKIFKLIGSSNSYYFHLDKGFLTNKCRTEVYEHSGKRWANVTNFVRAITVVPLIVDAVRGKSGMVEAKPYTTSKVICETENFYELGNFVSGLALVKGDDVEKKIYKKYGFLNTSGKMLVPFQYKAALDFSEGLAAVQSDSNGLWGFIDATGKIVIALNFKNAESFATGKAKVEDAEGNSFYIDKKGQRIAE